MNPKKLREGLEKRFPNHKIEFKQDCVKVGQASMTYARAIEKAKQTDCVFKVL